MGFTSPEESISEGQPIELYRITTAAGLDFRYTNSENEIDDADALTYIPASVEREEFNQSQQKNATEMVLRLPYLDDITDDFAQQFIDKPPEGLTTVRVQRHHLTDSGNTFVQFWEGRLVSAAYDEDGKVEVLCKGQKNIFERAGPRASWSGMCQHTLYDTLCGITPGAFADFNVPVTAIGNDGITITLDAGFLGSPLKDFVAGQMVKDNGKDRRLIVAQSGNVLTLNQPFRSDFVVGATVDIESGCNHTTEDCINKFSNIDNYGGFPYTPGLNPYNEGLDRL